MLSKTEKKDASTLYSALKMAEELVNAGEKDTKKISKTIKDFISKTPPLKIDYVSIVDTKTMKDTLRIKGEVLIALAVFIGKTRLIDNIIINVCEEKKNSVLVS